MHQWGFLLSDFNREQLAPQNLQRYAHAIHTKDAPLAYCWSFLDGTVRPESRLGHNPRALYTGHKRAHTIKFQFVAIPGGLVPLLHGPYERKSVTVEFIESLAYLEISNNIQCLQMEKFYSFMETLPIHSGHSFRLYSREHF